MASKKMSTVAMLAYAVTIVLISSLVLSANAIRCHQCNSHSHEDCAYLLVNTPRAQRDNQYLTECKGDHSGEAFCRKTVIKFEVNNEKRIERGCGWIKESHHNSCFTADNEGYQQVICTCSGDACNAAPTQLSSINRVCLFALAACSLLTTIWLRR